MLSIPPLAILWYGYRAFPQFNINQWLTIIQFNFFLCETDWGFVFDLKFYYYLFSPSYSTFHYR